jgi:hypothetical protein
MAAEEKRVAMAIAALGWAGLGLATTKLLQKLAY